MMNNKRHWAFKDITGQQFGRLTAVQCLPKGYGNTTRAMWECICTCGNKIITSGSDLRIGQSTSCGCLRSEKTSKAKRKDPYRWIYNGLFHRCKMLNRECLLSFEDFLPYTNITKCHYCNSNIKWPEHRCNGESGAYYLDRKDNNLGYTQDNCVVCCALCNWVKSDQFSYAEMIKLGKVISEIRTNRDIAL